MPLEPLASFPRPSVTLTPKKRMDGVSCCHSNFFSCIHSKRRAGDVKPFPPSFFRKICQLPSADQRNRGKGGNRKKMFLSFLFPPNANSNPDWHLLPATFFPFFIISQCQCESATAPSPSSFPSPFSTVATTASAFCLMTTTMMPKAKQHHAANQPLY